MSAADFAHTAITAVDFAEQPGPPLVATTAAGHGNKPAATDLPWSWVDAVLAIASVLLLCGAAALFAGCGGQDDAGTASADQQQSPPKTTQPVRCAASSTTCKE